MSRTMSTNARPTGPRVLIPCLRALGELVTQHLVEFGGTARTTISARSDS
jgi:hypothetical protein